MRIIGVIVARNILRWSKSVIKERPVLNSKIVLELSANEVDYLAVSFSGAMAVVSGTTTGVATGAEMSVCSTILSTTEACLF